MVKYVLGFCFDSALKSVVLIEKLRPDWQNGLLNGVGGKINNGESPNAAMSREFLEETKAVIPKEEWTYFCLMRSPEFEVFCYAVVNDDAFYEAETNTDEKVCKANVNELFEYRSVSNLLWTIFLAIDFIKTNRFLPVTVEYY